MIEQKGNVFSVAFADKNAIYNCFMNFTREGGFFVPTSAEANIGEVVHLIVKIPENNKSYFVSGKVCWQNFGRKKGFGVHLIKDDISRALKLDMEKMIQGTTMSDKVNYTM